MPNEVRLKYLFESARLGTMRAASEQLDVATSSVSRQISELENELGIALIEKNRRGIKLTEAGELVCAYYKEKRAHDEVLLSRIAEISSVRSGNIYLAVGEAFITAGFSALLRQFMLEYPGMNVRVIMSSSNDSVALVREDEAHFGLIFDIPTDPHVTARLTRSQPLHVIAHPKHKICQKKRVKLSDLSQYSIALPEMSYRIRQVIHQAEHDEGVLLEPSLVTNSIALLKDFAMNSKGITLLPQFLAQPEWSHGNLRAIPTNNTLLNSTKISLITRRGRQVPIGVYRLMAMVEGYLKKSLTLHP